MKKTIKNISLVYCWGNKNLGDKAITPGTIRFLKQVYPDNNLFVLSVFEKDCRNYKESEEYICSKFCDVNFVPQPLAFINEKRKTKTRGSSERIYRHGSSLYAQGVQQAFQGQCRI